ncbi:MAG: hypothetical protein PHW03_05215 [Eubacteriales bacterium]|nr:hypothetical protein [Eubacteriales bacterium]
MPRINDKLAIFGLVAVSLTAWGQNLYSSQAFVMECFGLMALSVLTKDKILILFGFFLAAWGTFIQAEVSRGFMIIGALIQAADSFMLIMAGYALYIIIKFGKISKTTWMNAICSLSILLSIIGIIQYFMVGSAAATLGCINFLAAFLAISAIFFYRRKWWIALPVVLWALFLTHTSTAILALSVGTGFFLWQWKGAIIGLIPSIAYFLIFKTPTSLMSRIDYWLDAIQKLSNHWYTLLFGVGPGILWRTDNMLHSEPVYLLWNFGIIGLLLAGAYVVKIFTRVPDRYLYPALIVIVIDSLGNHLFHVPTTAYLSVVIFALFAREEAECL